jgi:hypothetical protein
VWGKDPIDPKAFPWGRTAPNQFRLFLRTDGKTPHYYKVRQWEFAGNARSRGEGMESNIPELGPYSVLECNFNNMPYDPSQATPKRAYDPTPGRWIDIQGLRVEFGLASQCVLVVPVHFTVRTGDWTGHFWSAKDDATVVIYTPTRVEAVTATVAAEGGGHTAEALFTWPAAGAEEKAAREKRIREFESDYSARRKDLEENARISKGRLESVRKALTEAAPGNAGGFKHAAVHWQLDLDEIEKIQLPDHADELALKIAYLRCDYRAYVSIGQRLVARRQKWYDLRLQAATAQQAIAPMSERDWEAEKKRLRFDRQINLTNAYRRLGGLAATAGDGAASQEAMEQAVRGYSSYLEPGAPLWEQLRNCYFEMAETTAFLTGDRVRAASLWLRAADFDIQYTSPENREAARMRLASPKNRPIWWPDDRNDLKPADLPKDK